MCGINVYMRMSNAKALDLLVDKFIILLFHNLDFYSHLLESSSCFWSIVNMICAFWFVLQYKYILYILLSHCVGRQRLLQNVQNTRSSVSISDSLVFNECVKSLLCI